MCALRTMGSNLQKLRALWLYVLTGALSTACVLYKFHRSIASELPADSWLHQELTRVNEELASTFPQPVHSDSRLAPVNYSVVPINSTCVNKSMVIVVHVRPDDVFTRKLWRKTYGDERLKDQFSYSLLFSLGKPQKIRDQELIEEEAYLHGDILQTNLIDAYRNLTYKHLAELRYLALSCSDNVTLLKLDDDVVWDIWKISEFARRKLRPDRIYCSKRVGHKPMRQTRFKWTVSKDEWERETYPPHCAGLAYFTSLAVVRRMLDTVYSQRFFWIDDVFITGVLAEAANVTIDGLSQEIKVFKRDPDQPKFEEQIFLTDKQYTSYWFHVINYKLLT